MINEADGFLITLLSGRKFFIDNNHYHEDAYGNITFKGNHAIEIALIQKGPGAPLECLASKVHETPLKITWSKIFKHAILSIEKIDERSFIYETVIKARSNIVIPKGVNIGKPQKAG